MKKNKREKNRDRAAQVPIEQQPAGTKEQFLDRDLSWIEFNRRVLAQAGDQRLPLLERVRFLSIFASNLDEFVMKRIGGLKRQIRVGAQARGIDGSSASERLERIRQAIMPLYNLQQACLDELLPLLSAQDIYLRDYSELNQEQRDSAQKYFQETLFPILTPIAVDPGHPFPFLSNLSTSLGVALSHPGREEKLFARIKVPRYVGHWLQVQSGPKPVYITVEDLIQQNLAQLFPGLTISAVMTFRITRNVDLERDEEDVEDLMEMIEDELRQRKFAQIVRMEHGPKPDPWILRFLIDELGLQPDEIYEVPGELDFAGMRDLVNLDRPDLKFPIHHPVIPQSFIDDTVSIFQIIRDQSILVHHPYESFQSSVERLVAAAADDPKVISIKMTLYRTGDNSPFVKSLIRAAERNKNVICLVELKARFDEETNIYLAEQLEDAGVHVMYGVMGLKTHSKITLIVRQDPDGIRSYAHVGTGNYHPGSAKLYTDLGLMTCNQEICRDLADLFNYLTGRSMKKDYLRLLVAPVNMKEQFLKLIQRETEHAKAARPAQIIVKCNSLEDFQLIHALYDASRAGVKITLIVRGFCCLRPGVPGLSENIRVVSIIGRFLEHSRIFFFQNGADNTLSGDYFIGSADWMTRNMQNRVEVITPVLEIAHKERLQEIFRIHLEDRRLAWKMQSDGSYTRVQPAEGELEGPSHDLLAQAARQRAIINLEKP